MESFKSHWEYQSLAFHRLIVRGITAGQDVIHWEGRKYLWTLERRGGSLVDSRHTAINLDFITLRGGKARRSRLREKL